LRLPAERVLWQAGISESNLLSKSLYIPQSTFRNLIEGEAGKGDDGLSLRGKGLAILEKLTLLGFEGLEY
jgi:hypothetical protein